MIVIMIAIWPQVLFAEVGAVNFPSKKIVGARLELTSQVRIAPQSRPDYALIPR